MVVLAFSCVVLFCFGVDFDSKQSVSLPCCCESFVMARPLIAVRRAEADDVEWVANLASRNRGLLRQRFGSVDVPVLIEQSYLSITAVNDSGEVVGFAAFSDSPNFASSTSSASSSSTATAEEWLAWFAVRHGVKAFNVSRTACVLSVSTLLLL